MSNWTISDSVGLDWLTVTPSRAVVRVMILAPAVLAIVAQQFAAPSSPMWPAIFVLPLAAYSARSPDSVAAAFFITAYAVWWLMSDSDETSLWCLIAALSVLVFHASVAFAAAGPRGQVSDRASVMRWLRDTGAVAMATWGTWLVVAGLHDSTQSSEVLVGLALFLVAGLVVAATGPATEPPAGPPS